MKRGLPASLLPLPAKPRCFISAIPKVAALVKTSDHRCIFQSLITDSPSFELRC